MNGMEWGMEWELNGMEWNGMQAQVKVKCKECKECKECEGKAG